MYCCCCQGEFTVCTVVVRESLPSLSVSKECIRYSIGLK